MFPKIPKNRGFALVVTLSLMILLTVVAVGLLSLSSIALRQSSAASAMKMAQSNARLALMMALGELQRHAGPDQRITATADMAGTADGDPLPPATPPLNDKTINGDSKELSSVQPGTRYWTGVWRNLNTTNPRQEIYTKTPSPKFLQWLVSGSETGSGGLVTPASTLCAIRSDGTVADPKTAVVLVGKESVGDPSPISTEQYVAAPLVPISSVAGGNGQATGRYGWWVGDEGVKAKINIRTTVDASDNYASLSAQRRGWEAVDGFKDYPIPSVSGHALLPNVVTLPGTKNLVPSVGDPTGGRSPLQAVFHSATADSRAVLADSLNGGTKIDLTAILSAPSLPSKNPVTSIPNYPVVNTTINPRVGGGIPIAPKWNAVKEFYDRSKNLEGGDLIVKAATSKDIASIAPLITDIRLLMGVKAIPSNAPAGFKANACGKFAVGIANPYSHPLKWKNDLEFEVVNLTPDGNRPSRIWNVGAPAAFISTNEAAVFNKTVFRIRASSLAPGEARAYTVVGSTVRPAGSLQRIVVDLAPFGSSNPLDFRQCVELDSTRVFANGIDTSTGAPISTLPTMDVRESWQTTLIGVEMRLAGSNSRAEPLRRLHGFDLDNGYFSSNIRNYNLAGWQMRPHPIPLMCFSFQVSQPGMDYLSVMPVGSAMGQRASTLRTFADFNLQATRISKPITSYNPPPYFMESNSGFAQLPDNPSGQCGNAFVKNLDSIMPWGRNWTGSRKTVLFSVPTQFTSLAQFQHADLTGDDVEASVGHQPGNAFGNSYASPFVRRGLTVQRRIDYVLKGDAGGAATRQEAIETPRNYYDISYHLNASIWDTYFLSTINSGSADLKPENPSLIRLNTSATSPELKDPVTCATQLMIDGAFNVNCTDKNAWKAFLGSAKHFKHKADTTSSTDAAFPRSLEQTSPSATKPSGTDLDSFAGFRRLSDTELDALATELTKQVRLRGPFVSLSHFVNRALQEINTTSNPQPALTRSGALQSAIDESGATINFAGSKNAFAPRLDPTVERVTLLEKSGAPRADLDGGDTTLQFPITSPRVWAVTSADNNYCTVASILADPEMLSSKKNEQGYRSTGIPGWLTQADVLQVIGPSITNRSDTFRIRAYGESVDPTGKTLATAYCEAIVQRIPSYVDPANAASERGANVLNNINNTYGRQFAIVSFRWLSPQEI